MRFESQSARVVTCLSLCSLMGLAAGCGPQPSADAGSQIVFGGEGPLKIVATTGPVGDMVRRIAGDRAEVEVLMGPQDDPHLYKETPSDIKKLEAADIVFYSGLHLEGRITEVLERRGRRRAVFAVTSRLLDTKDERLRYPGEFDGFADPHVWHDASLWADCTTAAAERLAEFDAANAEAYLAAGESYRQELLALHEECLAQIAGLPENRRVLVTAHDAFGYFSRAYGLESVGLKGISTEDEVAFQRMDDVAQLIIDRGLPAVFVESSVAPRLVEALIEPCLQQGHKVRIGGELYADALGEAGTDADNYLGMMRANVRTIVAGLGG